MKAWILAVALAGSLGLGFGSGLLVGRQFPAKHYERFGTSTYLYDVSTGKLCNPFPPPNQALLSDTEKINAAWGAATNPPPCVK
jgi:hypothetical protein